MRNDAKLANRVDFFFFLIDGVTMQGLLVFRRRVSIVCIQEKNMSWKSRVLDMMIGKDYTSVFYSI